MVYGLSGALTALLFWWGTGLEPWAALTWLAPLPVLWVQRRLSAGRAFLLALGAGAVGHTNLSGYLLHLGVPWPVLVLVPLTAGLCFAAGAALHRRLVVAERLGWAAASLPAVWAVLEFVQAQVSIHGNFGSLAYTQAAFLPVVQVASWAGLGGIVFVLLLPASAVAARSRRVAGVALTAVALVLGMGWWRLSQVEAGPVVKVGLVAANRAEWEFPREPRVVEELARHYAGEARGLAGRGARLVVLPEKLALADAALTARFDAPLEEAARSGGAVVAAGLERWAADGKHNEVRWYAPGAPAEALYDKHHMLPPFESHLLIGRRLAVREWAGARIGVAICKDMDFAEPALSYGRQGVGLLVVPAWDFDEDGWLHSRMAVLRGVEGGYTVARAARNGRLTVSDSRGRVLAEAGGGALLAEAPIGAVRSFQAAQPWVFPLLNGLLLLALAWAARPTGRRRNP